MAAAARQRRWQLGGSVGCTVVVSAERQRQRGSGTATVGSLAAASAAQGRWRQRSGVGCGRRQLGGGGQRGGRVAPGVSGGGRAVAAAAARHWGRHGGRGRGGGSPITPAMVLPIPLLIAAARLGNVAVSLCGLRGGGRLLGGLSSSNVFYQYLWCCASVLW